MLGLDDASEPSAPTSALSDADIEQLVNERNEAREDGRYADADRIREQLAAEGVILEDAADGTRWIRK